MNGIVPDCSMLCEVVVGKPNLSHSWAGLIHFSGKSCCSIWAGSVHFGGFSPT